MAGFAHNHWTDDPANTTGYTKPWLGVTLEIGTTLSATLDFPIGAFGLVHEVVGIMMHVHIATTANAALVIDFGTITDDDYFGTITSAAGDGVFLVNTVHSTNDDNGATAIAWNAPATTQELRQFGRPGVVGDGLTVLVAGGGAETGTISLGFVIKEIANDAISGYTGLP